MCASVPTAMSYPAMILLSSRSAAQRCSGRLKKRQQQEAVMPLSAWIILGLIASLFVSLFPSFPSNFPSSFLNGTIAGLGGLGVLGVMGVSEFLSLAVLSMAYYAVSRYAGAR
jgi:hypothetical protein